MVTHGAPVDTFWDIIRKGATAAAAKDNVEFKYSSDPSSGNQANLIQSAIDSKVDGLAVTLPDPPAIAPAVKKAIDAGIPVVAFNAGIGAYAESGALSYFGSDESLAGETGGKRAAADGYKKVLCVVQFQGQVLNLSARMGSRYSTGNTLLIGLQRPDATCVAGYEAWRKAGRQVRRGELGIADGRTGVFGFKGVAVSDPLSRDSPCGEMLPLVSLQSMPIQPVRNSDRYGRNVMAPLTTRAHGMRHEREADQEIPEHLPSHRRHRTDVWPVFETFASCVAAVRSLTY